jgi:hypothetical protein
MMGEVKGLLTRLGDAVEAAKDKAQEVGASLAKKAEVAASGAKREAKKPRTLVGKKARVATARVKRRARAAEADARRALGTAKRTVKVKAAAAGTQKVAGKVERAMSPKRPKARPKSGAARKLPQRRKPARMRGDEAGEETQGLVRRIRGQEFA